MTESESHRKSITMKTLIVACFAISLVQTGLAESEKTAEKEEEGNNWDNYLGY